MGSTDAPATGAPDLVLKNPEVSVTISRAGQPPAADPFALSKHDENEDAAELADFTSATTAYRALSAGSIDRIRDGAKTVQTAATAIAGLYSGLLAATFALTEEWLPRRGILTPLWLGVAVVLSTVALAWVDPRSTSIARPTGLALMPRDRTWERTTWFVTLSQRTATRQSGAMAASVVALACGLAFTPLPFIDVTTGPAGSAAAVPLPEPTLRPGWDPKLAEIRYAAEIADARAANQPTAVPDADADWVVTGWSAGVGVVLVFLGWFVGWRRRPAAAPAEPPPPATRPRAQPPNGTEQEPAG